MVNRLSSAMPDIEIGMYISEPPPQEFITINTSIDPGAGIGYKQVKEYRVLYTLVCYAEHPDECLKLVEKVCKFGVDDQYYNGREVVKTAGENIGLKYWFGKIELSRQPSISIRSYTVQGVSRLGAPIALNTIVTER
jgi:hypothetical protein